MQDISLTYDFMKKLNAANIHRGVALLAAYHNAVDVLARRKSRENKDFKVKVEQSMRSFS